MASTIKLENPDLDTGIEVSLIEKAILDNEQCPPSKIKCWTATKVGDGRGYVSHMIQLKLVWSPENSQLPGSVVLKVPTVDTLNNVMEKVKVDVEKMDLKEKMPIKVFFTQDFVDKAQKAECGFYNYARDEQLKLRLIPKCYLASVKEPALLIFEDLCEEKYITLADELTLKQTLQVAELLAELHAHCIKHPNFKDSPHFDNANPFLSNIDQRTQGFKAMAEMCKKKRPDYFDPLADRMPELAKSSEDMLYITKMNELFNLPDVVVHGDLHVQNMAFGKDDLDTLRSVYDWQITHTGCVVEDIGRLLCFCADPALRRRHLEAILTHYYQSLGDCLAPMKTPFSYDTLRKAYDKVVRYATAACIGGLFVLATMPGALGDDAEAKGEILLTRAKCLLEDCLELIDAGKT